LYRHKFTSITPPHFRRAIAFDLYVSIIGVFMVLVSRAGM